jgi:hypothetical protein
VFGYAEERRQVDLALTQEVLSELEATGVLPRAGAAASPQAPAPVAPAAVAPALVQPALATAAKPVAANPQVSLGAPAGPVAAALDENIVRRSAQLDEREQMLRQRERELAEQRRILAEEYRLLRARHVGDPGTTGRIPPAGQAGRRFDVEATQGFWNRVKRVMLGISAPTVEGS